MANNIEIKAYATNFAQQVEIAVKLCGQKGELLHQHDIFFNVEKGRLKLRQFPNNADSGIAQLIYYKRSDTAGPKNSEYHIYHTHDPEMLTSVLSKAHGIKAEVRKTRRLFLHEQTRVHFDKVEGLGEFIELEVVLDPTNDSPLSDQQNEGLEVANQLMKVLGITNEDLINCAYVDLL